MMDPSVYLLLGDIVYVTTMVADRRPGGETSEIVQSHAFTKSKGLPSYRGGNGLTEEYNGLIDLSGKKKTAMFDSTPEKRPMPLFPDLIVPCA